MKLSSHWRLASTIGLVLGAVIVIALPALSVLSFPLGTGYFAAAFIALVLSIGAIIWLYSAQGNHTVVAAKDAEGVIKTIPLIFFTIDKQMQLSRLRSTRFEEFFRGKNFGAGTEFSIVIGFLTDSGLRQQACDYVKLMLAHGSCTISGPNPLDCVPALMLNSNGRPELSYFKFGFSDYFENGKFAGLLVAINDISGVVNISAQLQALTQKSDQSAQASVDLMIQLIKQDRKTLQDKLAGFENLLDETNLDLKDSGHSGVRYQTLADRVHKKIRVLKSEAAALEFGELSQCAAEMLTELEIIGQKPELSGNDFFSVALKLDELYDCLHKLGAMVRQLPDTASPENRLEPVPAAQIVAAENAQTGKVSPQGDTELSASPQGDTELSASPSGNSELNAPASDDLERPAPSNGAMLDRDSSRASSDLTTAPVIVAKSKPHDSIAIAQASGKRFEFALIQQACIRTAEKLGKKVAVVAKNLAPEAIPDRLKQPLTEILVQLIRSSLSNGLELPAIRLAAGKDETGTLTINWTELANGGYELLFRDDGCGLNFDVIRARALALNRLSGENAQALESRQLVGLIFEPGFSTAIKTGDSSGFGAGLDLVMAAVKNARGKISVGTQAGLYTQFRVSFPE